MPNRRTARTNFHQAKWDEEIIFQLHNEGEIGLEPPKIEEGIEKEIETPLKNIPENMLRKKKPELPEIGQMRVLKHFLRLSQQNLGADLNIDVGQGTCTIKYSPKINKQLASHKKVQKLHPLQNIGTIQGSLEIFYRAEQYFKEISGMDRFSFQPSSGSHAIFAMASIMHKYHKNNGEAEQRKEIITTIFSHPSDAAAAAVKGYDLVIIPHSESGLPKKEALKEAISEKTAGLLIANPEDTGIFNPDIKEYTDMIHDAGGLCGYDQANANGLLGITRAKEAGFDMCFFNLHKTFSAPHGCGGPASGVLGVIDKLVDYLPVPIVDKVEEKYILNYDLKNSIGKIRQFYGVFPVILKAYSWMAALGGEGLKTASETAVLNNNYLLKHIAEIEGADSPFPAGEHRIEQVRYTWEKLYEETGIDTFQVSKRLMDFGFHLWQSHHPFLVPQPFTIEPTESYSKAELDEYLDGLRTVVKEAHDNPEIVENAPHQSVVHEIDNSSYDDPENWAISWRMYCKQNSLNVLDGPDTE